LFACFFCIGSIYSHHSVGANDSATSLLNMAVERGWSKLCVEFRQSTHSGFALPAAGLWDDVRQRPSIYFRKLAPSTPFLWENTSTPIQGAIDILESNYDDIKDEVLKITKVPSPSVVARVQLTYLYALQLDQADSPYLASTRKDAENLTDTGSWKQVWGVLSLTLLLFHCFRCFRLCLCATAFLWRATWPPSLSLLLYALPYT
jgi:hypothetical protein